MLEKSYRWTMEKAGHPHAVWWLCAISFTESSFFPIPPDVLLIPMVLAAPSRWFYLATMCTLSSVAGGYLGYAIGHYAMEAVGYPILGAFHLVEKFQDFKPLVDEYGAWVIVVKGATPIPYKLITIAAGAFDFDLLQFTFASIVARGMRFYLVAILLYRFGPSVQKFVEKRLKLVMLSLIVLALVLYFALR